MLVVASYLLRDLDLGRGGVSFDPTSHLCHTRGLHLSSVAWKQQGGNRALPVFIGVLLRNASLPSRKGCQETVLYHRSPQTELIQSYSQRPRGYLRIFFFFFFWLSLCSQV